MPETEEIYELINLASERIESEDTDSLRSYEEGIKDALNWVLGSIRKPL